MRADELSVEFAVSPRPRWPQRWFDNDGYSRYYDYEWNYNSIASYSAAYRYKKLAVGGACGLALLGSATSDIAGFLVIALSPMGLFANFGIFSAAMIALSLFASLVLTTAALGLISKPSDNLALTFLEQE